MSHKIDHGESHVAHHMRCCVGKGGRKCANILLCSIILDHMHVNDTGL